MKARIALMRRRAASPSREQSSAATCHVAIAVGSRPALVAAAATSASDCAMVSRAMPKLMKTPSAVRPAAASAFGPDAARNTRDDRRTHGKWASSTALPRSNAMIDCASASSSSTAERRTPTFRVPLCPAPMPRIARPGAIRSSEGIAAAETAGCRVTRLVTHSATSARLVACAAIVAATQGSIALPGVSAMPIMS